MFKLYAIYATAVNDVTLKAWEFSTFYCYFAHTVCTRTIVKLTQKCDKFRFLNEIPVLWIIWARCLSMGDSHSKTSSQYYIKKKRTTFTKSNTAVFQQVAKMVKQGSLIVTADAAKITEESTTAGHHLGKGNFLTKQNECMDKSKFQGKEMVQNNCSVVRLDPLVINVS